MLNHKRFGFTFGAILATTLAWATPGLAQDFTMKLAHYYPESHVQAGPVGDFVKAVEEKSEGRIKVQVYGAQSLVTGREALEALEGGVVEAALMAGNYQSGSIHEIEFFTYPFIFEDAEHFRRAVNADGGIFDMLVPLYEARNIKLVNYYHKGALHLFHRDRFLNTPEAYEGQRLRSLGPAISALLTALGANPLSVPVGEVEAAIERKVIDGLTTNCAAHLSRGWAEGLKYATYMDMSQGGEGLGINMDFYNSLPEDLQQVINDAADEMAEAEWTAMINDDEVACFDKWAAAGVEVHRLTEDERATIAAYMEPIMVDALAKDPGIQDVLDIAEATK
jgi:TRAP-type C4-dicarboxylate transport system substrate-binding protein